MIDPLASTPRTRRLLLALLFTIFYVPFIVQHGLGDWGRVAADFPTFYFAPRLAFRLGMSPYDNQALAAIGQKLGQPIYAFLYPPSSLSVFYPVAFFSYPAAWHGLLVASHLALLAVLWLLAFRFPPVKRRKTLVAALSIAYVLSFKPVGVTFQEGQINLLALFFLVLAWRALRPSNSGPAVAGEGASNGSGLAVAGEGASNGGLAVPGEGASNRGPAVAEAGASNGGLPVAGEGASNGGLPVGGEGASNGGLAVGAGRQSLAGRTPQAELVAGLCLALAILFKAYFALALGLLVISRRYRPVGWCLAFLGLASLFTWLLVPGSIWLDWAVNVAPGGGYGRTPNYLFSPAAPWNQSLNGFFSRLYLTNPFNRPLWPGQSWLLAVQYAVAGLIMIGTVGLSWVTRQPTSPGSLSASPARASSSSIFDLQFSLWLATIFLLAPFSWEHHLVFVLPAVLIALREAWLERLYPALILLVLAAAVLAASIPYDGPALGQGPWTLLISVKLYAVVVLWLELAWMLGRFRPARRAARESSPENSPIAPDGDQA